jgi:hypothetical protein
MRFRALTVTAVVAVGLVSPSVFAAPKKACNLVVDPTGDTDDSIEGVVPAPADPGLDLVGGDFANDTKKATAIIRLANDPGSATWYAKRYIFQATIAGLKNPLILAAAITPTGTTFSWGYYGATTTGTGYNYSATAAEGKINGKEIVITALLADIAGNEFLGAVKPGAKVNGITITANRRIPSLAQVTGFVYPADTANGKLPYAAGAASCVKVGG